MMKGRGGDEGRGRGEEMEEIGEVGEGRGEVKSGVDFDMA